MIADRTNQKTNFYLLRLNQEWSVRINYNYKMPHHCNFIKQSDHQPCGHAVATEGTFCGIHAPIAARMPERREHQCEHIAGRNRWCPHPAANGDRLCRRHVGHRGLLEAAAQRAAAEARHAHMHERAAAGARGEAEAVRVQLAAGNGWVDARAHRAMDDAFQVAPPAVPVPALERLALDTQNVHTGHVSRQTREGEAKLLAVPTDGKGIGLRVLRTFANRGGTLHQTLRVMNDVDIWYSQRNCRTAGDRLYGRLLEGLWALILQQPPETQHELLQRLWEEMSESVGMCCEGHIGRLVNVMVGFDESFKPKVSLGEVLQTKIAAIAAMNVPTADKLTQARAFMTELAVPVEQQAPWLDALE